MVRETIKSPYFGTTFYVADNLILTEQRCPIDETPLVHVMEYDFSHLWCFACDARYSDKGIRGTPHEVHARNYVEEIQRKLEEGRVLVKDVPKLEGIVEAARAHSVI